MQSRDLCEVEFMMAQTMFSLAIWKLEHGSYPDHISDLPESPAGDASYDLFGGDKLKYEKRGDGYNLYSVGLNAMDDGGVLDSESLGDDRGVEIYW